MSHPETWAKKKTRPTRGDVCLTQRRGQKKKQDPLGGTYVSPRDVGKKKKTRPTRGTYVSPRDVGKEMRPMWGSTLFPPTGLWRRGLLMPLLPLRGDTGAYPVPPDKKGGAYCCPSLQSPPVKGRHRSSSHVPLGSSPHAPPHHIRSDLNERENQLKNNKTVMYSSEVLESFFIRYSL